MNIPLDNLYDWIAGIAPDTVIYRFYPHGSKNITDLTLPDSTGWDLPWRRWIRSIPVICHDQEPLDFDYYNINPVHLRALLRSAWPHRLYLSLQENNQEFWRFLATKNITMVAQPTALDRCVLLHSEQNSRQIQRHSDLVVGAYWWSHAMISRDWYRFAQHDPRLITQDRHQFDFNIYCRAWSGTREYRLQFLQLLVQSDLQERSRITFCDHDQTLHYREHQYVNQDFVVKNGVCLKKIPVTAQVSSDSSATYDPNHYNSCWIDIVLETLFDDERWYLTEKSLRPIACGKPFIMVATPGSLRYLRGYGFHTFGDVIDESYDDITDPMQRLQAITRVMTSISAQSDLEKKHTAQKLQTIADHNRKLFFSDDFAQNVINELRINVIKARNETLTHHLTGYNWTAIHQLSDREALDEYVHRGKFGNHRDIMDLLSECRNNRVRSNS